MSNSDIPLRYRTCLGVSGRGEGRGADPRLRRFLRLRKQAAVRSSSPPGLGVEVWESERKKNGEMGLTKGMVVLLKTVIRMLRKGI